MNVVKAFGRLLLGSPVIAAGMLAADDTASHAGEILRWQAGRDAALREPDGWLSFTGSGTVPTGSHSVGSGTDQDIVLPSGPAQLGVVDVDAEGDIHFTPAADAGATIAGKRFRRERLLTQRDEGGPTRIDIDAAWFYVVRLADGSVGWRMRDPSSPALTGFKGLDYFPIDESWRIQARWQPFDEPETLELLTSAGTPDTGKVPGVAVFERDGGVYTLRPIVEADGQLFFIFADRTSGRETYGAARFLYANPAVDGKVVLDFNKAYNPPCALTPHVVCPLAPPENRLALAVTAGEKKPPK
ncbi:DUF1684 domain-containing protein [Pseudofulvimonas gallinarii]|jgi:uncharacterized protein (DUF1684 family)|uniref:DUF1684 domain-containing protein n=1 Tax=Pseudofulvimonas gallinarii TaxID=634155 RepID=A0A4R3L4I6_9GAMM|nr:DUF1684 domain-containing protein [Pseudofulvimonas gallinarii]TCS93054.1 hypothetical protein EDC25_13025 [Pseudofulvimonas gallinarii]THD12222.1 hypothetical protein B1808_13700 [Pseudofulvimonas gallinarii]